MIATALLVAGAFAAQPVPLDPASTPTQRSGYPKLHRCASPVARPEARAGWSPACIAWRVAEMRRLQALPAETRATEIAALRDRMGLPAWQGLSVDGRGRLTRLLH